MKKIIYLLLSFFLADLSLARDFYAKNVALDIERYRYFIELNDHSAQIKGSAVITVRTLTAMAALELDLGQADKAGKGMQVLGVTMRGQDLTYQHQGEKLKIILPETVATNTVFDLQVDYEGEPRSGLHIGQNKFGDRVFFADNWPDQGRQWLPSIDHPRCTDSCQSDGDRRRSICNARKCQIK
jgi:aminopeptidase N